MASNLFGNPVTDDTVRLIYPSLTKITAKHRAQVAMQYKSDERAKEVSKFVHSLKNDYGSGTSTLGMIYNATGGDLKFSQKYNWDGSVYRSPYPQLIQNGQWAGFLHVRDNFWGDSKEAIVYSGTNIDGVEYEWMLCWKTTQRDKKNRVFTDIRERWFFGTSADWSHYSRMLQSQDQHFTDSHHGCYSSVLIAGGSSPEFVGTMSLTGLSANFISKSLDSKCGNEDDIIVYGKKGDATPAAK